MPDKDMTFLQAAPPNSFVAMDAEQTRILVWAASHRELKEKIKELGLQDVVLWRNPPFWGHVAF